ncbi:cytochrome P450 2K4-like [Pogona vitticeps]
MATGVQTLRRSSNPTGSLRVRRRPCTLWLPPDSALQLRPPLCQDLITVRVPASRNSPSPGLAARASAGMPPRIRQGTGKGPLSDVPSLPLKIYFSANRIITETISVLEFLTFSSLEFQLSKQYGPVFSLQLGLQKMVVLTGYETVKEALVNQADAFAERPFVPVFEEYANGYGEVLSLDNPLLSYFSHGENWKVMRRFAITTLRDYGMGKRSIEYKIVEECNVLIKTFESYEGKPFETTTIMNAAVANIIGSILLGKRLKYEDSTFQRLLQLINENVHLLGSPSVMLYNMFPALGFLFGARKIILNNRDELHAYITATFLNHIEDLDKNDQRSLIDTFLIQQQEEEKKKGGYFHKENLKSLMVDLFSAGMETTSSTLCWGILLMMKYPEIQKKVQAEIDDIVGPAQPMTEHRIRMPYTDAVVHEVQRFRDIVPNNLPRTTTVDVTLKGYFIPKGTHVVPLLTSVLHDESQWEKPHEFYPEHFLDSAGKFVKRDAFMPFSAGRRMCAGETMAKMELFLFFMSLLQRFTFQPPPGTSKEDLDLTQAVGLTAPPMPFHICALPR